MYNCFDSGKDSKADQKQNQNYNSASDVKIDSSKLPSAAPQSLSFVLVHCLFLFFILLNKRYNVHPVGGFLHDGECNFLSYKNQAASEYKKPPAVVLIRSLI